MPADLQQLKLTKDVGHPEILFSLAVLPGTQTCICGGGDGKLHSLDLLSDKTEFTSFGGHTSYVTGVAVIGNSIISSSWDGKVMWWDRETKAPIRTVAAHNRWIRRMTATPDGRLIVTVADDMLGKVWNAENGELVHTLEDHKPITPHHYPSMLFACTVSPDGTLIATGDKVGHIAIWETASGKKIGEVEAPGLYTWDPVQRRHSIGGIRSLAFSQDNLVLAAGGIGHIGNIDHLDGPSRLELYDWKANRQLAVVEDSKFKGLIERLQFHPEGNWLIGSGGDHGGFLNFYQWKESPQILKQEKLSTHVHDMFLTPEQDTLIFALHGKLQRYEFKKTA